MISVGSASSSEEDFEEAQGPSVEMESLPLASNALVPYSESEEVPHVFMIARNVILYLQQPNIFWGARQLWKTVTVPSSLIKLTSTVEKIDTAQSYDNGTNRRVARKLCFDDTLSADSALVLVDSSSLCGANF
jgi:hypothetical protein